MLIIILHLFIILFKLMLVLYDEFVKKSCMYEVYIISGGKRLLCRIELQNVLKSPGTSLISQLLVVIPSLPFHS